MSMACHVCGQIAKPGARFCMACGNTVHSGLTSNLVNVFDTSACPQCSAVVGPNAHFCRACGAELPTFPGSSGSLLVPDSSEDKWLAESILASLDLAPNGILVVSYRPGSKRPRRCEVQADGFGSLPLDDRQHVTTLLIDSLAWDGYLFATILDEGALRQAACVWHVLNGEVFPLTADHAQSMLIYLDDLAPSSSLDWYLERTIDAPYLDSRSAPEP